MPQNPPAYDPQANGAVERGVQEFMNQMRAMKIGLEQRIQMKIDTSWNIVEWMVELAPTLINRCLVGHDGKTPCEADGKELQQGYRRNRRESVGEDIPWKTARGSKRYRREEGGCLGGHSQDVE